jgi:enoyl-CoA hydratase/carnithine racemase
MPEELVHYRVDDQVASLVLDSQHNRNALSRRLVQELYDGLARAEQDDDVKVVQVRAEGRTFCSGADMSEASKDGMEKTAGMLVALQRRIVTLPKPVVARVHGNVRAGGIGIVAAADIAVAAHDATFAFTEVRLGLAPAIISLTTLGRMAERAASRYYLTGETFDAATAARSGLITEAADDLDASLAVVCDALRACSPQGLAETKPLTTASVSARFAADAAGLQALSQRLFESDEAREGIMAFLQKRPPRWAPPPATS